MHALLSKLAAKAINKTKFDERVKVIITKIVKLLLYLILVIGIIDILEIEDQTSLVGKVAWVGTAGVGLLDVGLDGSPFVAKILVLELRVDVVFWLVVWV